MFAEVAIVAPTAVRNRGTPFRVDETEAGRPPWVGQKWNDSDDARNGTVGEQVVAARLNRLHVTGLRCLHGLDLAVDQLTALIGANGAGKSSTVRALQFLFGQVDLDADDITDGLADSEVIVTGVFTDLPAEWADRLRPWLTADGDLEISRRWSVGGDGKPVVLWSCERAQGPGVAEVRAAVASGAPAADLKDAQQSDRSARGRQAGRVEPPSRARPMPTEALQSRRKQQPGTFACQRAFRACLSRMR